MTKQMKNTILKLSAVAIIASSLAACAPRRVAIVHTPRGNAVVIKKGHVHNNHCGHYRVGTKWYFVKGHVHKKKCGHAKVKGVWIVR